MLLNNLKSDIKGICAKRNANPHSREIAELGIDYQSLRRWNDNSPVSAKFIDHMERLGYDIEITYRPKEAIERWK